MSDVSRKDCGAGRADKRAATKPPPHPSERDERTRIIEAFVPLVAELGYVHVRVSDLTKRAQVTRARFYALFKDKEECFLCAQRELAATLADQVRAAVAQAHPATSLNAGITVLCDAAENQPASFALLTHEATLAGPRAYAQREAMMAAIGGEIERRWEELLPGTAIPELADGYLLGGALRALGIRMRRGEGHPKRLLGELTAWLDAYQAPKGAGRWRSLISTCGPVEGGQTPTLGPIEPAPLPRGRHRLPEQVAKRSQRERILHATGRVTREAGYANSTVAEIVAAAGVSREVFYEHFHDKEEAFAETIRLVFEQIIAASAGAFFSSDGSWPERISQACEAFVGFVFAQPSLAYPVFTEPYAVVPELQRADEFVLGFTIFLEEGYRYRPQAARVPRIAGEAIGGTVLEAINAYMRGGHTAELPELAPGITYVVLAPFMGTEAAYEFVVGKAGEGQAEPPA